jgi:hypothetical protein
MAKFLYYVPDSKCPLLKQEIYLYKFLTIVHILIQLLCLWTLSIVLFLFKTQNVLETGFYIRLQVEPTQLGPMDRASLEIGTSSINWNGKLIHQSSLSYIKPHICPGYNMVTSCCWWCFHQWILCLSGEWTWQSSSIKYMELQWQQSRWWQRNWQ